MRFKVKVTQHDAEDAPRIQLTEDGFVIYWRGRAIVQGDVLDGLFLDSDEKGVGDVFLCRLNEVACYVKNGWTVSIARNPQPGSLELVLQNVSKKDPWFTLKVSWE